MLKLTELIKQYEADTPVAKKNPGYSDMPRRIARSEGAIDLEPGARDAAVRRWKGVKPKTQGMYITRVSDQHNFWLWATRKGINLADVHINLPIRTEFEPEYGNIVHLTQVWAHFTKGDWHTLLRTCREFGYIPSTGETNVPEVAAFREWVKQEITPHLDMFEHFEWDAYDCRSSKRFLIPATRQLISDAIVQWSKETGGATIEPIKLLIARANREGGLKRLWSFLHASIVCGRHPCDVNTHAVIPVIEFLCWAQYRQMACVTSLISTSDLNEVLDYEEMQIPKGYIRTRMAVLCWLHDKGLTANEDTIRDLTFTTRQDVGFPSINVIATAYHGTAAPEFLTAALQHALDSEVLTAEQVNNPAKALLIVTDPTLRFLLWGNIKEDGTGTKVSVKITTKLIPAP